jgi:hypothetical protein
MSNCQVVRNGSVTMNEFYLYFVAINNVCSFLQPLDNSTLSVAFNFNVNISKITSIYYFIADLLLQHSSLTIQISSLLPRRPSGSFSVFRSDLYCYVMHSHFCLLRPLASIM